MALLSMRQGLASRVLNKIDNVYQNIVKKFSRRKTKLKREKYGVMSDIGTTHIGSIAIDMPSISYKGDIEIQQSISVTGGLESLVENYDNAIHELKESVEKKIEELETRKKTIEDYVENAQLSRTPEQFRQSIDGLNHEGIRPHISTTGNEYKTLRKLGKLTFKSGEKLAGIGQILQSYKMQLAGKFKGEFPASDEVLFNIEKQRYEHEFYEPVGSFDIDLAKSRYQYGENMVDFLVKEYALNPDKTVSHIIEEAEDLYRIPISNTSFYRVIDDELGTRARKTRFTALSKAYSNKLQSLDRIVEPATSQNFLDNPKYRRLIRGATLGTSAASAALVGGLPAALTALGLGLGAGYFMQKFAHKLTDTVGEDFAGSAIGGTIAGMKIVQGDYIGASLNGVFAGTAFGAGIARKKGKNKLADVLGKVATGAAGVAALYTLVTTGTRLIDSYQTNSLETITNTGTEIIEKQPNIDNNHNEFNKTELPGNQDMSDIDQPYIDPQGQSLNNNPDNDLPNLEEQVALPPNYELPTNYTVSFNQGPTDVFFHNDPDYGLMLSIGNKTSDFLENNRVVYIQYQNGFSDLLPLVEGKIDIPNESNVACMGVGNLIEKSDGTYVVQLSASETLENWLSRVQ